VATKSSCSDQSAPGKSSRVIPHRFIHADRTQVALSIEPKRAEDVVGNAALVSMRGVGKGSLHLVILPPCLVDSLRFQLLYRPVQPHEHTPRGQKGCGTDGD
jgi:hypothetical protein